MASDEPVEMTKLKHDFQSDLHAILHAIRTIQDSFEEDPAFCKELLEEIGKRETVLCSRWEEIKRVLL